LKNITAQENTEKNSRMRITSWTIILPCSMSLKKFMTIHSQKLAQTPGKVNVAPSADFVIKDSDIMVIIGEDAQLAKLAKSH
jgi:hypothetical protein